MTLRDHVERAIAFLLGLVQSHYEIKSDVELIGDFLGSGKVPINAGIAADVPSQKIVDVLTDKDLVKDREHLAGR